MEGIMYNEEIKQRFIEDYKNNKTISQLMSYFKHFSKIEKKYKNDLFFISYDDISTEILKYTNILSYRTYYSYLDIAKIYKQWCMINDIFSDSNYFPVKMIEDADLQKKYKIHIEENIFKSYQDLHKYIDDIFEINLDRETIQKQDFLKLTPLLLYHGVHEKDIFNLRISSIIEKRNGVFIEYRDKLIRIHDEETAALLLKRVKCSTYEIDRGRWTEYVDLTDYIINYGGVDVEYNRKQTRHELSRQVTAYNKESDDNKKMQAFNIYVCGVMRHIKEDEKINNYKIKIKDLYKWFEDNGYSEDVSTPGKKKIIKEIYKAW